MRKSARSPQQDSRYRNIFEHAAVPLWEVDISRLRARLKEMGGSSDFDLRAHMAAHPEFVQEAIRLVEVTEVNEASVRLFEAEKRDQLLRSLDSVPDAVSRAAIGETILAVHEGRTEVEAESTAVTLKGNGLFLIVKTYVPPADAAYQRMVMSLTDITARKAAEMRERGSAAILHSIIESSPDALCVKDRSLKMVLCNSIHSRSVGKEPRETYGKTDIENGWDPRLVNGDPQDGIPGWEKDDREALAGRTVVASGVPSNVGTEIRYFDAVKMPLRGQDGAIIGMIGIGRDVTERRRAEELLAWERTLLTTLLDSLPDRIYFKDTGGRFIRTSRSHALERGLSDPSEEIGKSDADFSGIGRAQKAKEDEQRIISTGEPLVDLEELVTGCDGREAWLLTTKMPFRNPAGEIIGTFGISHDITARKAAEQRERESVNILHSIIDSFPDSIFVKDTSLRMVLCNTSLARAIGKTPQETYGRTDVENGWSADLVKGNAEKGIAGWEKDDLAALSGRTVRVTDEPSDFEGGVRYFDTVKIPLRDEKGSIIGLVGIGRDVTERRRAQEALAQERRRFDLLMDNLPDYIYFKDLESRFIRNSRSHAQAIGLRDPSEAVGKTDFDFFGPESARQYYEDEQRIIHTGVPMVDTVERETFPDRPDAWVITTKMPYRDERGEIAGTFGISHDITRRVQLEEKNQQLATLVESSNDAIVGIGMDRTITVWNRGAERVYGYSAVEMIGAPTSRLIPPELENEVGLIRELARGEPIEHFETTRLRKDGTRITVSLSMSAIRDTSGRMIGMASVARDVTAQKAIQAQLNRVQRLESLATLAAGVAHQFNNLNTIVKGYLDLLGTDRELPGRLEGYVGAAAAAVLRAVVITERLQTMARPPGDPSAVVRLDLMARTILASFESRIAAEQVRLVLSLSEAPPALGEDSRLKFACSSLIANALDSLLDRPVKVINVRTGRAENGSFFEVEDTGCGIPERDLPQVFTPFFSRKGEWAQRGSAQARLKGLGLDLAISSAMVSDYGGRIEVHSTEGAGSIFRILLPLPGDVGKSPA